MYHASIDNNTKATKTKANKKNTYHIMRSRSLQYGYVTTGGPGSVQNNPLGQGVDFHIISPLVQHLLDINILQKGNIKKNIGRTSVQIVFQGRRPNVVLPIESQASSKRVSKFPSLSKVCV